MSFLLDTNTCIYALNQSDALLAGRFRAAKPSRLFVSSITLAELLFGAAHSARPEANTRRVAQLVAPLRELPFGRREAESYGGIRAALAARGKLIGSLDMLIAATALAHGLTVVTNNLREFDRVPGLRAESWASPARS
ncbi:MAG: type II toxin-antitoxin system VapC family toxin [Myxococcales bacterium]|nr:type II toxin-antitoxin system VapC family toxin [Myxococcales bacterium]